MKNCHRDKRLDSLLGKIVKITFIDGTQEVGKLIWVEAITSETPYKPQMYHCGSWSFYKSHIKSVVSVESKVKDRLAKVFKGFANPFGPQRTCEKCKNKRSNIIVPLYDSVTDKRYVLCRYCAEDLCEELAKKEIG